MTRFGTLTVCLSVVGFVSSGVLASPDTFSIDANSPSPIDPAALLNPGITVQVPAAILGLVVGDELDALSLGMDAVQDLNIIFFSVDRGSQGVAGPLTPLDVNGQALLNQ